MNAGRRRWAIVLGAGDGSRLSALTTRRGVAVPKQFCTLNGGLSLLQLAIRRAQRVVDPERVTAVVAAGHSHWWRNDLREIPSRSVVVQPQNRGTAAGVLLPLAAVRAQDPEATVAILPSDHWVADERVLAREIGRAFEVADTDPGSVVLLGVEPDSAETGYGWILPGAPAAPEVYEVGEFVEKPAPERAEELLAEGAVWNSFMFVARVETLWNLLETRLPDLVRSVASGLDPHGRPDATRMQRIYEDLPPRDFSRHALQGSEAGLRLVRVPECGWTDLGTPERVAVCVERVLSDPAACVAVRPPQARIDLAWALAGA